MARYKPYSYDQTELIPVSFSQQILPGTFEYALVYLIDEELNLSLFDERYNNDHNGRPAYDPAILLKIVLLAYSRGITSSRKIERLCRENVLFMSISANTTPHFTTIADFIAKCTKEVHSLFLQVLMICDEEGLIGKEMFAIDGCKIPSNASKKLSGKRKDLKRKLEKLDTAVTQMLEAHQKEDLADSDEKQREREVKRIARYKQTSARIKEFLESNDAKIGRKGKEIQGNVTDPDSAKMKSSHGTIQGYIGVATVDAKHQVIVSAEAFGKPTEQGLLEPVIEQAQDNLKASDAEMQCVKVLADSGYHSKETMKYVDEKELDAYVADNQMRRRDVRFDKAKAHHKPKAFVPQADEYGNPTRKFGKDDFHVDYANRVCICPAGKEMPLNVENFKTDRALLLRFRARPSQCAGCHLRAQCLRHPEQRTPRSFAVMKEYFGDTEADKYVVKMKKKIDTERGQSIYSLRLGLIEPVFGHITDAMGLRRFSFRGKDKVDMQWKLFSVLHNMLKIHRFAWGGV